MGIFDFFKTDVVKQVADGLDSLFTSDEERLKAKNMLAKIEADATLKAKKLDMQYEKQISNRWTSDNSGNFLTKSIRPITLIYMLVLITIMIFGAMFGVQIPAKYLDLVQLLSITVFGAFFGGKSIERIKAKVV